jgi:hypothetical protein
VLIVLGVGVYRVVSHDKVVAKGRAAITAVDRLPSETKTDLHRIHP